MITHVTRIELMLAVISYQDYHMLLLTLAGLVLLEAVTLPMLDKRAPGLAHSV